jgi:hypothetical protein
MNTKFITGFISRRVSQKVHSIYDDAQLVTKRRLSWLWIMLSPLRYLNDRVYLRRKFQNHFPKTYKRVDQTRGFERIYPEKDLVNAIVERTNTLKKDVKAKNKKEYLQAISNLSDYDLSSPEFKLATSPMLVAMVSDYLGTFPHLFDITAMWSPPPEFKSQGEEIPITTYKGSQLFHRDGDDLKIVKIWILCTNVNSENGPTILISADESEKICRNLKYRQGYKIPFETEQTLTVDQNHINVAIGSLGTVYFTDTDRLLHYGSRTESDSERLVLMIQYVSFFSLYKRRFFKQDGGRRINDSIILERDSLDDLQRALLRDHLKAI